MKLYSIKANQIKRIELKKAGEYTVALEGAGAEAEIVGAFTAQDTQDIVIKLVIHHKSPHTRANTTLRGIARDAGRISFAGRIIIDEDCGDSNSFLTERILLLSDTAKAEAIPDLEIKTDDVKCSHAASISRIPEEHLFYLMSRGLSQREAEELIVQGFLSFD